MLDCLLACVFSLNLVLHSANLSLSVCLLLEIKLTIVGVSAFLYASEHDSNLYLSHFFSIFLMSLLCAFTSMSYQGFLGL